MDRRFIKFLLFSCILHSSIFLFIRVQAMVEAHRERLIGIEFIEEKEEEIKKEKEKEKEKKIKEPPKPMQPKEPTKTISEALRDRFKRRDIDKKLEEELKKLDIEMVRPMEIAPLDAKIDLDKIKELSRMQASIDLDAFEALDVSGDVEIIRIGTGGKSLNDLLDEPTIALPRTKDDLDAKIGLFSSPGSGDRGGIELEKVDIAELKREKETDFRTERTVKTITDTPRKRKAPETMVEIAGALAERNLLTNPNPVYPRWALKRGLSSTVTVKLTVGQDGRPKPRMLILRTTGHRKWDEAVMKTLAKWRWEASPATHTGRITFRFILGV